MVLLEDPSKMTKKLTRQSGNTQDKTTGVVLLTGSQSLRPPTLINFTKIHYPNLATDVQHEGHGERQLTYRA